MLFTDVSSADCGVVSCTSQYQDLTKDITTSASKLRVLAPPPLHRAPYANHNSSAGAEAPSLQLPLPADFRTG